MVPRFSFHNILDGTVGKTINLEAHPSLLFLGEQLKNKIQQFNNFELKKKKKIAAKYGYQSSEMLDKIKMIYVMI